MIQNPKSEIWPGEPYPLGATYDGAGTNFSVFSEAATQVDLCLFDDDGREERIALPEVTGFCWHGYIPNLGPGKRYGFRVHGPYAPERGVRCDPGKLLLDPYAKAVVGDLSWHKSLFSSPGNPDGPLIPADSAPHMPRSVVVNPYFNWQNDRPPKNPWHETVIYELHVKGFTRLHPEVPERLRGTYAGLAHPAVIDHLTDLGITAVELLPVHHFVSEHALTGRGLNNYWGYNSISYFAPHAGYASSAVPGGQVQEFKQMVRMLHEAGIEIILDVVYNHTAEGDHRGPTLCFRGLDNNYYRLAPNQPGRYVDYTGCGNSLNMRHPHVLQLIMDSLRYWVLEMHVDGFRFDLAAALARELHAVDRLSAFFDLIHQDPVLQQVKLIAEPWDVGEGGYQVGNFPPLWSEWNGKYRDTVRDFWRGQDQTIAELAYRFTGSSDLYETTGRRPYASINFVTAHDGFTLRDLVSYNHKHNDANGEGNRDGESHNRSWNCGVEGPTDDPAILALRARQQRNFLVTLIFSQGVPMLVAGDELGRTQGGNNNAYCQDNEVSWIDWAHIDHDLLAFVTDLIAFRETHPVLQRRRWFQGQPIRGKGLEDIGWFRPDGDEMSDNDWKVTFAKALGIFLNGDGIPSLDRRGHRVKDDSFYIFLNGHYADMDVTIPPVLGAAAWVRIIDTSEPVFVKDQITYHTGDKIRAMGRSVLVLRRVATE
ncbi:MAG TPA: glycogen debranching protein GlgX [Kofleriaceae bacterium]|nr:glycogen debranching protein GlgX [Kofleriaceae bacterium]